MESIINNIPIKLLNSEAKSPKRSSEFAAGLDLYTIENVTLKAKTLTRVKTGIAMQIPRGCYGQIASRSSLAAQATCIAGGVIDSDYRGEIIVMIINLNDQQDIQLEKGDRIAQILILPVCLLEPIIVDELDETKRNTGGFGSTGK